MNDTDTRLILEALAELLFHSSVKLSDPINTKIEDRLQQLREAEQKPVVTASKLSSGNLDHIPLTGAQIAWTEAEQKPIACRTDDDSEAFAIGHSGGAATHGPIDLALPHDDTEPLPPSESPECVLAFHLSMVLPMAKGYAAEHPYGKNQEIVNRAAEILDAFRRGK